MKLGLIIEIISEGEGTTTKTYNSTPALEKYASASRSIIKDAFPTREDLRKKRLDANLSLDESKRTVTFLRFLGPQGYLICIFQARPEDSGRPYDGAAAWIHVPASVVLSGSETEKLIDDVEAALSSERSIDYARLEAIFSKDYNEKNQMPAIAFIRSNGESSAVRYYGKGTDYQFRELLGNDIAQPIYGNYKAVFFLRKNDAIAVTAPKITAPLTQTCIMSAPTSVAGYNAFFETGKPFNEDLEYPQNTPLKVIWKKPGYQDIPKTANAKAGDANEIAKLFDISKAEVKVAIKKQIFNVIGGGRQLENFQITIDGNLLENDLYIQEDKLAKGVKVEVKAKGFENYSKIHKLEVSEQNVEIPLKEQSFIYKFAIPMYDGKDRIEDDGKDRIEDGEVVLETSREIKNCPIKGYSLKDEDYVEEGKGNINHLEKGEMLETMKHFAYGFLTCVGIILAILLYNTIEDIDGIKSKSGFPWFEFVMHSDGGGKTDGGVQGGDDRGDGVVVTEDTIDYCSFEYAKSYLNSKDTWCKDSIAKYPSLNGLFEAFNEYKFDEIVNVWADSLKDVSKFSKIVNAADLAMNGKWNPRLGDHNPDYNKDNDNMINLTNYANWISADQTPKPEVAKSQSAAKPQKQAAKSADPANNNNKKKRGAV